MRKVGIRGFALNRIIAPKGRAIAAALVVAISAFSLSACEKPPDPDLKVGWMTSWSTAAQIIQALERTNIPELYGVPLQFKAFLWGPEVNEAALAGEVDVVNNGLVPTISLLAADEDWVVVARLIDSPLSIIVRKNIGISKISNLKGRRIGVPFGGGSHPYLLRKLKEAQLSYNSNLQTGSILLNVKPSDQALLMERGEVQAVATWEPQSAMVLSRNLGDAIDEERHFGVITVRKKIAKERPDDIVKLLEAYYEANLYAAQHKALVDTWYCAVTGFDKTYLPSVQVIESNMKAKNIGDITLDINGQDLSLAQSYADTMAAEKMTRKKVDFASRCDFSFLKKAMANLQSEPSKTKDVKPEAPSKPAAKSP